MLFGMKRHKIKVPIYNALLNIIIVKNMDGIQEKYSLKYSPKYESAITFVNNEQGYIVFVEEKISPSTIAHEAKHFVNIIFDSKGIALDLYNDEPECYLLGWVVEQIHKLIPKPK